MVKIIIQNITFDIDDKVISNNQYIKYLYNTHQKTICLSLFDNFEITGSQLANLVSFLSDHDFNKLEIDIILRLYYLPNRYICDRNDIVNYLSNIQTTDISLLEKIYEFAGKNHIGKLNYELEKKNISYQYIQLLKQVTDIDFGNKFKSYNDNNKNQYHNILCFGNFLSYSNLDNSISIFKEHKITNSFISSIEQFNENLKIFSDGLIENDFQWNNVILSGGSCYKCLTNDIINTSSDIDLWIYGSTDDKKSTYKRIVKYFNKKENVFTYNIINEGIVTFVFNGKHRNIQLIYTKYETPQCIPNTFDIDYLKMYFDGDNIMATYDCIIALKHRCIFKLFKEIKPIRMIKSILNNFDISVDIAKDVLTKYEKVKQYKDATYVPIDVFKCDNTKLCMLLKEYFEYYVKNKYIINVLNKYYYPQNETKSRILFMLNKIFKYDSIEITYHKTIENFKYIEFDSDISSYTNDKQMKYKNDYVKRLDIITYLISGLNITEKKYGGNKNDKFYAFNKFITLNIQGYCNMLSSGDNMLNVFLHNDLYCDKDISSKMLKSIQEIDNSLIMLLCKYINDNKLFTTYKLYYMGLCRHTNSGKVVFYNDTYNSDTFTKCKDFYKYETTCNNTTIYSHNMDVQSVSTYKQNVSIKPYMKFIDSSTGKEIQKNELHNYLPFKLNYKCKLNGFYISSVIDNVRKIYPRIKIEEIYIEHYQSETEIDIGTHSIIT